MRTTITLESDVAVRLERLTRERGITFKEAVNSTLRAGLDQALPQAAAMRYVLPTFPMGVRPGIDLDRARHLDAELEDDEIMRKLAVRK
jgi:hypothetical protein